MALQKRLQVSYLSCGVLIELIEIFLGIIDTRPIEQRTNYISFASLTNNVTSDFNLITINDASSTAKEQSNGDTKKITSHTYLLKNNQMNNKISDLNGSNHQRHMSVPVYSADMPGKSLPTSSSTLQESITKQLPNTSDTLKADASCAPNLQLYVKMKSGGNLITLNNFNNSTNSNANVSYENINLEYISRLMKEGYSKENVVAALGISRNNFEMACDILHEFVSTNQQPTKVYESNG